MSESSTPTFSDFVPLPYQSDVLSSIDHDFDYQLGMHEVLLSGSVGSAKSLLLAHAVVKHCIKYARARVLVGRRSTPDLRLTIWRKILEHLEGTMVEGEDYNINLSRLEITFANRSEVICRSWADGQYLKLRSLELSAAVVEELTENDEQDKQAYDEIRMRVGRLPHVKENWIMSATNPSDPGHWAYKHFIEPKDHPTRHVYYSVTTDNPYLPPQYIEQLKNDLDPKMARRMIYGEWLEISGEVIYYAYDTDRQYKRSVNYVQEVAHPIILSWDFNIAENKPMSMVAMQYINDTFHIFDEVIIHGSRTADTLDELDGKQHLFIEGQEFWICGDAAGRHRDTRSLRSDYDIILKWAETKQLRHRYMVPLANPPVRKRHNIVNAYCKNANGEVRLFVYPNAKTVDEGLRLTKLKSGANYVEDDSKYYQHCTTSVGYAVNTVLTNIFRKPQGHVQL